MECLCSNVKAHSEFFGSFLSPGLLGNSFSSSPNGEIPLRLLKVRGSEAPIKYRLAAGVSHLWDPAGKK